MALWRYVLRRLSLSVLVLVGVTVITFLAARVIPADPAARWVGPHATAEQIERARQELGLDRPLVVQFADYVGGLVRGDWGVSVVTHQPVLDDLLAYLPPTLELVVASTLIALALGVPLGVLGARYRDRLPDHLSRLVAIAGVSMPTFWLAMLLQLVFFRNLGWLPLQGRLDTTFQLLYPEPAITGSYLLDGLLMGDWSLVAEAGRHLVLPAVALAAYPIGLVMRMVRSSVSEVLYEDHIRTARALGVAEGVVLFRYALKPALGPVLTVVGLSMGYSLTGAFLVEAVFGWPGLGRYAATALVAGDYPAIMGVAILVATAYVILNLVVDLLQAWLDPRIALR
ncbi:MAG: ABC transporter permease [Symbiobacteriaceae bacterium]